MKEKDDRQDVLKHIYLNREDNKWHQIIQMGFLGRLSQVIISNASAAHHVASVKYWLILIIMAHANHDVTYYT